MGIVLRGGTVVSAIDGYQAEVRIEGEKVVAIGSDLAQPHDRILHVDGCYLLPGGIDTHTHFDLPAGDTVTADDFASGTKAALIGGTTTIIDFATQFKGESLAEALANWQGKAQGKSYADYAFHMVVTDWHEGIPGQMSQLVRNEGLTSFKFYMAYKTTLQVDDGIILAALRQAKQIGALVCLHCENGDVVDYLVKEALAQGQTAPAFHPQTRPVEAEAEATARAITLAEIAGAPLYVVHLTCRGALQAVAKAKSRGMEIYAETCPQYLLLDDNYYKLAGFEAAKYVISPPLRAQENQDDLWHGLQNGILDTVATDHCSFNFNGQKEAGRQDFSKIPNGMPGVETRMGLLYTYGVEAGRISLNQMVALTATQPAKIFGLFPRKGTIAPGSDADIVVWDPDASSVISARTQYQNVDYAPYEGFRQSGRAAHVFLRGRQAVTEGKLSQEYPEGIYIPRKLFRPGKGGGNAHNRT